MSCIVRIRDKSGRVYAFESTSYWDKEKKAPRTKRTYLGRVDENGNIIPKKVVPRANSANSPAASTPTIASSEDHTALLSKLDQISTQLDNLSKIIDMLSSLSGRIDAFCNYAKV